MLRVEAAVYLPRGRIVPLEKPMRGATIRTSEAWGLAILGVLGLVIALNSLGLDVANVIGTVLHGTEHLLDQPLFY
jgi:hypothetical protein